MATIRHNGERFLGPGLAQRVEVRRGDAVVGQTNRGEQFDVVYAWGSLHHTGEMWRALENAGTWCAPAGFLIVAIYNRTWLSPAWLRVKRVYHAVPIPVRLAMAATLAGTRGLARGLRGKAPFRLERGMSVWHDAVDWLGGLPYEYASRDDVIRYLGARGFALRHLVPTRRSGCNEFVFVRG